MNGQPAFTIETPTIAFGEGALEELGVRARALGMRHAALMTDPHLAALPLLSQVQQNLEKAGLAVTLIADLESEPTDRSLIKATDALAASQADGIVSFGGGSVIDTAKAANLYVSAPAPFLAYVNAPVGEGREPDKPLLTHIACPTTCGTGSECTGIAVFDYLEMKAKTGIMSRKLVPDLALVDPAVTRTLPKTALVATALDALSHAMEAYTCRSFHERGLAADPAERPMTQGANPWSDAIAEVATRAIAAHMANAIDEHDKAPDGPVTARAQLMWAATLAGNAFGNAGCHVPHALSYPVSGLVRGYRPADYPAGPPLVPHGLSVLLATPAVFRLTGPGAPQRHHALAQWLGVTPADDDEAAGEPIAEWVERFMSDGGLPTRLREIGYDHADIPALVAGASPQRRLLDNAPVAIDDAVLKQLFEAAL